jgi:hypothetical protein
LNPFWDSLWDERVRVCSNKCCGHVWRSEKQQLRNRRQEMSDAVLAAKTGLEQIVLPNISDDDKINLMADELELELLLSFDGASYEASGGYVVEFTVRRTDITAERPHGISYALVCRPANGEPFVRFDNAHAPNRTGGKYVKAPAAYDHWHRDEHDVGRPYKFTTALLLLNDFWREVKRVMDERGIPNDL